jgi:hypothetical protein
VLGGVLIFGPRIVIRDCDASFIYRNPIPERTYLLTVGIIALIFIVSMTIPFASILIGAVLLRHARWKEIVLVSSLGSATGGNRRLVLALKSGWSIRKRWRSSWRKATGLSSSLSPP